MKLFTVIVTIVSTFCQFTSTSAQAPKYDDITKRTYEAAGWTYSTIDSQYIEYQSFETSVSPNKKCNLLIRHVGLSDLVTKSQYHLVRLEEGDTTLLMDSYRHDAALANYYWARDDYLIFEKNDDGGDGEILVWNLTENNTQFSTDGVILARKSQRKQFYDPKNNLLFFFISNQGQGDLMSLDLSSFKTKKIKTFASLTWEYWPTISHDKNKRTVIIKHWTFTNDSSKEITETFSY